LVPGAGAVIVLDAADDAEAALGVHLAAQAHVERRRHLRELGDLAELLVVKAALGDDALAVGADAEHRARRRKADLGATLRTARRRSHAPKTLRRILK